MSAAELRAKVGELSVRVVDQMYEDPFWMKRFGSRGRLRSEEDIAYHVEYVAQAIDARDPSVMVRYAQWLRTVLTSRGMCTRHLDESFERLAAAVPEPLAAATAGPLKAAREALLYPEGPARDVQDATARITAAALATLRKQDPSAVGPTTETALVHHLSYLADALATGKKDFYDAYVAFVGRDALVDAIAGQLDTLPPETARSAHATMGA